MAISFVNAIPSAGTLGAGNPTPNSTSLSTSFDATGCDAIVVYVSAVSRGGSSSGATFGTCTYAGVAMTVSQALTVSAASASASFGVLTLLAPTSGSNTLAVAYTGGAAGSQEITVTAVGYTGVASIGNVGTLANPSGTTANSPTASVSASTGNLAVGGFMHGDTITGAHAGTTLRKVNNYSGTSAGGCQVAGDAAPSGGTGSVAFDSSTTDSWMGIAIELVASGGGGATYVAPTILVRPAQAVHRAANW